MIRSGDPHIEKGIAEKWEKNGSGAYWVNIDIWLHSLSGAFKNYAYYSTMHYTENTLSVTIQGWDLDENWLWMISK